MAYSIKEAAEKTCLQPHVLRYYEKEGLLPGITRTTNGLRRYTEEDLEWLSLMLCLKNTRMSSKQSKEFVELSMRGAETLKERCDILREHKKRVEAQIEEMRQHLDLVTRKINYFTARYQEYVSGTLGDDRELPIWIK